MYEPDEYEKSLSCIGMMNKRIFKRKRLGLLRCKRCAKACLLAIEKDNLGNQVFHITAPDTIMPDLSQDLVKRFFPNVSLKREVQGHETLMAIDKARDILGYEPRYSWRSVLHNDGSSKARLKISLLYRKQTYKPLHIYSCSKNTPKKMSSGNEGLAHFSLTWDRTKC